MSGADAAVLSGAAATANSVEIVPSHGDADGSKMKEYEAMYQYSITRPEEFWAKEAMVRPLAACLAPPDAPAPGAAPPRVGLLPWTQRRVALGAGAAVVGAPVRHDQVRQARGWQHVLVHERPDQRLLPVLRPPRPGEDRHHVGGQRGKAAFQVSPPEPSPGARGARPADLCRAPRSRPTPARSRTARWYLAPPAPLAAPRRASPLTGVHLPCADAARLPVRQRAQGARHWQGRPRHHLHGAPPPSPGRLCVRS